MMVADSVTRALLVTALVVGVAASLPTTVLTTEWNDKAATQALIPESWQFFTRNPQSPSLVIYEQRISLAPERAESLPQTRAENAFGLSRNQRSQDSEKAVLASEVTKWNTCGVSRPAACLKATSLRAAERIVPVNGVANFCGEFILAVQVPTPFNYRDLATDAYRIVRAARIDVRC